MKRCGLPAVLLACVVIGAAWVLIGNQPSAGQPPDEWRQLSLPDFVRVITQLTSGAEPISDALWTEIRSQSAERLLGVIAAGTPADYGDLVSLYLWARPVLTPEQITTVLAGLEPPANQVSTWTYEQMRTVHARMNEAGMPVDSIHALTLAWLDNRDVRTIANVDELGWLFAQVQLAHRQEIGRQAFTVRWSGSIQGPADGVYTLSICPLALNFRSGQTFREETTKIFVADQQILDSTENGWTYAAHGVTLAAGERTPLRIELSFACSSSGVVDAFPAVALLYWEAPGMARQLVPSTALVTPDGSQQGLQGEYVVQTGPSPGTVTRVDKQLNFIWYHQCSVVSPLADVRSPLADQLYAVASDPSTLARWEAEPGTNPEHSQAHWALLESLDVTHHQSWAQLLVAHPALLQDCANWAAASVYSRCRIGAPDEALQVIGLWAQLHSDEPPVLAVDFYLANRRVYRELSRQMVSQYPAHLERFDEDYLILPDGRCALPVAYTLAYGYWVAGRIEPWVDRLEARLADEQLTGDRRVNWLLARAQAEEIRRSPPYEHWLTVERSLAGRGWMEEACLVAQSEPVRLRAYRELAARLTAEERLSAAQRMLDDAARRCPGAESAAALAQWRGELDGQRQAVEARRAQQEAAAQDAYRARLRARYQRAVDAGDTAAAARYEALLSGK